MPTTASAPSAFASGCAPTRSATPANPTAIPASICRVTRCSWKKANASTALKIGTDAWMIDARPESIRVSPQERSQNGTAVLSSPTTVSHRQWARSWLSVVPAPTARGTTIARVSAASASRPRMSVAGSSSRSAILMNMNELPQMRASTTSMGPYRLFMSVQPVGGASREMHHDDVILEAGYSDPLSSVAEPLHRSLGLTDGEFDRIQELLGRSPNDFELAVFSLLW